MFQQVINFVADFEYSWTSIVFIDTLAIWLGWRVWRFSILPSLRPLEPQEYPYWIPFIGNLDLGTRLSKLTDRAHTGHAVQFLRDSESLYTQARLYFENTREPFALKVAGTTLYIVTSTRDVPEIYRNSKTLSFDEYIRDTVLAIGASKASVDKLFSSVQTLRQEYGLDVTFDKSLIDQAKGLYAQQFLPGPHLQDFWPVVQKGIDQALQTNRISPRSILRQDGATTQVSLLIWVREILMEALTTAVFGPRLLELRPDLMDIFTKFDNESWKMNYQVPPSMCPEFYKNKAEVVAVLKQYFELPKSQRPGAMWFVTTLESYMHQLDLPLEDIASFFLMPLWVTNSNAYKSCFWMLAHILHDRTLYTTIKTEVDAVLSTGATNLAERLDECPRLMALWSETLRHHVATASVRTVESDTNLGRYKLKKGGRVLIPYHQLHIDESAFGSNASGFDAERFLNNKDFSKSPSYRPFGGGITYCSGRIVARWEVFTLVALALNRFDFKLVPGLGKAEAVFPTMNEQTPTLGVMPPAAGEDVYIEISEK